MRIIIYNYKDLGWTFTKFGTYVHRTRLPNFSPIEPCVSESEQFSCLCEKNKKMKKNQNFGLSYLRNGWRNLLQIWNVASHHRWALPQQI